MFRHFGATDLQQFCAAENISNFCFLFLAEIHANGVALPKRINSRDAPTVWTCENLDHVSHIKWAAILAQSIMIHCSQDYPTGHQRDKTAKKRREEPMKSWM